MKDYKNNLDTHHNIVKKKIFKMISDPESADSDLYALRLMQLDDVQKYNTFKVLEQKPLVKLKKAFKDAEKINKPSFLSLRKKNNEFSFGFKELNNDIIKKSHMPERFLVKKNLENLVFEYSNRGVKIPELERERCNIFKEGILLMGNNENIKRKGNFKLNQIINEQGFLLNLKKQIKQESENRYNQKKYKEICEKYKLCVEDDLPSINNLNTINTIETENESILNKKNINTLHLNDTNTKNFIKKSNKRTRNEKLKTQKLNKLNLSYISKSKDGQILFLKEFENTINNKISSRTLNKFNSNPKELNNEISVDFEDNYLQGGFDDSYSYDDNNENNNIIIEPNKISLKENKKIKKEIKILEKSIKDEKYESKLKNLKSIIKHRFKNNNENDEYLVQHISRNEINEISKSPKKIKLKPKIPKFTTIQKKISKNFLLTGFHDENDLIESLNKKNEKFYDILNNKNQEQHIKILYKITKEGDIKLMKEYMKFYLEKYKGLNKKKIEKFLNKKNSNSCDIFNDIKDLETKTIVDNIPKKVINIYKRNGKFDNASELYKSLQTQNNIILNFSKDLLMKLNE